MVSYIDDYRDRFGVEPICRVLPIAPSTYYEMKARERDPGRLPPRAIKDEQLKPEIWRVHAENYGVYGARKVWKQLNREGIKVARCRFTRLTDEGSGRLAPMAASICRRRPAFSRFQPGFSSRRRFRS